MHKKRLSDMSDEEIRKAFKKKPEKWTLKTHDKYMERLNELHRNARMHRYGRSGRH